MAGDALDNIQTFQSWATDYYEPMAVGHYDQAIGRMLRLLAAPVGGTILDAGCGTGVHSIRVAQAGFRVQSVDISSAAIDDARPRVAHAGVGHLVALEHADLTTLRFPDATFDAVFSWGVLIHIPEIEKALQQLVRVLKPGGRLALQITNRQSFDFNLERLARVIVRRPDPAGQWTPYGIGSWCDMHGGRLYNCQMNVDAVTRFLGTLGCRRTYRGAAEFTELQRRCKGPLRTALRRVNNLWFELHLPAWPANTNLLIFERSKSDRP